MCSTKYEKLIQNNHAWAAAQLKSDKNYFKSLSEEQRPPFLFIGCSDSRKPVNLITQTGPGELFIHRNMANQISLTDMNVLSVIEYAVEELQVSHIIVCGHHGCMGVEAAVTGNVGGNVENWITPIKDIYRLNKTDLDALPTLTDRVNRLSELNVIHQVENVCKTSVMHRAFKSNKYPRIHGWVFMLNSGLISELPLPLDSWKANGLIPDNY